MRAFQIASGSLFLVPLVAGLFCPNYKLALTIGVFWNVVISLLLRPHSIEEPLANAVLAALMAGIGYGIRRLAILFARQQDRAP